MRRYYQILGVRPNATSPEIKEAWLFSIKAFHPDKFGGSSQRQQSVAQERTKAINEAYAILSDPAKRAAYDYEFFRASQAQSRPEPTPEPEAEPEPEPKPEPTPEPTPVTPPARRAVAANLSKRGWFPDFLARSVPRTRARDPARHPAQGQFESRKATTVLNRIQKLPDTPKLLVLLIPPPFPASARATLGHAITLRSLAQTGGGFPNTGRPAQMQGIF